MFLVPLIGDLSHDWTMLAPAGSWPNEPRLTGAAAGMVHGGSA